MPISGLLPNPNPPNPDSLILAGLILADACIAPPGLFLGGGARFRGLTTPAKAVLALRARAAAASREMARRLRLQSHAPMIPDSLILVLILEQEQVGKTGQNGWTVVGNLFLSRLASPGRVRHFGVAFPRNAIRR